MQSTWVSQAQDHVGFFLIIWLFYSPSITEFHGFNQYNFRKNCIGGDAKMVEKSSLATGRTENQKVFYYLKILDIKIIRICIYFYRWPCVEHIMSCIFKDVRRDVDGHLPHPCVRHFWNFWHTWNIWLKMSHWSRQRTIAFTRILFARISLGSNWNTQRHKNKFQLQIFSWKKDFQHNFFSVEKIGRMQAFWLKKYCIENTLHRHLFGRIFIFENCQRRKSFLPLSKMESCVRLNFFYAFIFPFKFT